MKTVWLIENTTQERYADQYLWKSLGRGKWLQFATRTDPNTSWQSCLGEIINVHPRDYFSSLKFEEISEDDVFIECL